MCGRDDDPTQHDKINLVHAVMTNKTKIDIVINNTQVIIGQEYLINNGLMDFHGKVLGIKTGPRGNDLSVYMLADKIGEIGIPVKDIETIVWVTESI